MLVCTSDFQGFRRAAYLARVLDVNRLKIDSGGAGARREKSLDRHDGVEKAAVSELEAAKHLRKRANLVGKAVGIVQISSL